MTKNEVWKMRILFSMLLLLSACSPKEEEQEPDYDNMVMADIEAPEMTAGPEEDRKFITDLLPDPQETAILE
jgi:hypothetical protein